jgi:hypothetical protein
MLFGPTLPAQNIDGDWQGPLKADPQEIRFVLEIDKAADGKWDGTFTSIDQSPDWGARTPLDSITLVGGEAMKESSVQMASPSKALGHKVTRCRLSSGAQPRKRHGAIRRHIQFSSSPWTTLRIGGRQSPAYIFPISRTLDQVQPSRPTNHARPASQSLFRVATDIPRTSAASFSVKPPK